MATSDSLITLVDVPNDEAVTLSEGDSSRVSCIVANYSTESVRIKLGGDCGQGDFTLVLKGGAHQVVEVGSDYSGEISALAYGLGAQVLVTEVGVS